MSKPDVLMFYPLGPKAMAQMEEKFTLHRYDLAEDKEAFLAEVGPRCRAVATNGHIPLTRAMIAAMPALELVACSSAGYESFDVQALAERGITLTNSSAALCDDVADLAILLMLAARRSLIASDAYVRSGDWACCGMFPLQRSIAGKTLGIVGMGTIGKAIAKRAQAMGMNISYWNRRPKDVEATYQPDLIQLAKDSDTLIVIVAGGPATRHLISHEVIRALGAEGLLVNVSRGSVVDEEALIAALRDGGLGHAALDVFASEPDPDPRLTALPNTTLVPHHGSGTVETREAMSQVVVDNLDALFAGGPLASRVDLRSHRPD